MKNIKKSISLCFALIMVVPLTSKALFSDIPMPSSPAESFSQGFDSGVRAGSSFAQQQNERRRMQIEQQRFQLEQERSLYQQRLWDAQMELIEKEKDPAKKLAYMQSLQKSMNSSQ